MTQPGETKTTGARHLEWGPKRAATLAGAQRSARLARFVRIGFFIAIAAIALPVAWLTLRPAGGPAGPEPAPAEDGEAGVVRMTSPRFTGRDTEGRPFEVLARTAIRRPEGGANVTELEAPSFYDGLQDAAVNEGRARVQALRGVYDSDARVLELYASVDLETRTGYVFRTSMARIFVDERRAEGDERVEGEGPLGTLSADRWRYVQDGAVLHFEGNVRTVLYEDGRQAEDSGE